MTRPGPPALLEPPAFPFVYASISPIFAPASKACAIYKRRVIIFCHGIGGPIAQIHRRHGACIAPVAGSLHSHRCIHQPPGYPDIDQQSLPQPRLEWPDQGKFPRLFSTLGESMIFRYRRKLRSHVPEPPTPTPPEPAPPERDPPTIPDPERPPPGVPGERPIGDPPPNLPQASHDGGEPAPPG